MGGYLSALFCGTLFGLGLTLAQMTNPEKVLGFLDVAGHWDPSLALVMAGADTGIKFQRAEKRAHRCPAFDRCGIIRHRLGIIRHLPGTGHCRAELWPG